MCWELAFSDVAATVCLPKGFLSRFPERVLGVCMKLVKRDVRGDSGPAIRIPRKVGFSPSDPESKATRALQRCCDQYYGGYSKRRVAPVTASTVACTLLASLAWALLDVQQLVTFNSDSVVTT